MFKTAAGTDVQLDLNPGTHLPLQLRRELRMNSGERVRIVVDIAGYATVDELLLPRTLSLSRNGVLYSERQFVGIQINPPLTPEDFRK
jgi:hypothetical protein